MKLLTSCFSGRKWNVKSITSGGDRRFSLQHVVLRAKINPICRIQSELGNSWVSNRRLICLLMNRWVASLNRGLGQLLPKRSQKTTLLPQQQLNIYGPVGWIFICLCVYCINEIYAQLVCRFSYQSRKDSPQWLYVFNYGCQQFRQ